MRVRTICGPKPKFETDSLKLYLDDARNVIDCLPRVDLVIADPPYASGARRSAEKTVRGKKMLRAGGGTWFASDSMTSLGYNWLIGSVFFRLRRRMKEGDHFYVFTDWRRVASTIGVLESVDFRVNHVLVWDKTYFGMGTYFRNQYELIVFASVGQPRALPRRDVGTVLRFKPVSPTARSHPTEKPVDLLRLLVSLASSSGDVVVDPFYGTGSTVEAAVREGRRGIGIELNPDYVSVAVDRLDRIAI